MKDKPCWGGKSPAERDVMNRNAKMMLNMAESIAKINGVEVERIDLQKVHMGKDGRFDHYVLTAWYSDGKEITIREDCTIVEKE